MALADSVCAHCLCLYIVYSDMSISMQMMTRLASFDAWKSHYPHSILRPLKCWRKHIILTIILLKSVWLFYSRLDYMFIDYKFSLFNDILCLLLCPGAVTMTLFFCCKWYVENMQSGLETWKRLMGLMAQTEQRLCEQWPLHGKYIHCCSACSVLLFLHSGLCSLMEEAVECSDEVWCSSLLEIHCSPSDALRGLWKAFWCLGTWRLEGNLLFLEVSLCGGICSLLWAVLTLHPVWRLEGCLRGLPGRPEVPLQAVEELLGDAVLVLWVHGAVLPVSLQYLFPMSISIVLFLAYRCCDSW